MRAFTRVFRMAAALACVMSLVSCLSQQDRIVSARPPNIVIFLADDLGYHGLGVQGDREVRTPNIDALAKSGVRLTDFYANHPVCSPSRAALLTGAYQHRMGFENNSGPPAAASPRFGIGLDTPTLPERLKQAGYTTGMFGKWHVGFQREMWPTSRGFDSFYGFLSGAHPFTPEGVSGSRVVRMMEGDAPAPMPAHTTEEFARRASEFIRQNAGRPFFAYVSFNAVHAPLDTTRTYAEKFAHVQDPLRRTHLAMLAAMDDAVGQVMATIREKGLEEDTLVFFMSDNGGPTQQTTSSNAPLNGVKGLVLEGGIRVPGIASWKGVIPAGGIVTTPTMMFDVTTTALAAAGAPRDGVLDGIDALPILAGTAQGDASRPLFWRVGAQGAMRQGQWKLIKNGNLWRLFDLVSDIGERVDLSAREPAQLARMQGQWLAWSASMKDPLWVRSELSGGQQPDTDKPLEAIESFIRGERAEVDAAD
jgi:arylsulfatase A-like enzyme